MIIVAAFIAIVQIEAQRNGTMSPITTAGSTIANAVESTSQTIVGGIGTGIGTVIALPQLTTENQTLISQNAILAEANAKLSEQVEAYKQSAAIAPLLAQDPRAIPARAIGFPPENESLTITIDRGARTGVHKDEGVLASGGVVGVVQNVGPFSSEVVLVTDYTSRIPVVIARGRWWGIARGNLTSIRVEYISQDASLRIGDVIVTGEARSFHSGDIVGTITGIERNDSSLYQTAIVKPAVNLSALDNLVVVSK